MLFIQNILLLLDIAIAIYIKVSNKIYLFFVSFVFIGRLIVIFHFFIVLLNPPFANIV